MPTQWHRVEDGSTLHGHALEATVRSRVWRAHEIESGEWVLVSGDTRIVVDGLASAREIAEGKREQNPAGAAVVGSIVGAVAAGMSLSSVAAAIVGSSIGAAAGAYATSLPDRRKRSAAMASLGGLLGPAGAAAGAWRGGLEPDDDYRIRNPSSYADVVDAALERCFDAHPPRGSVEGFWEGDARHVDVFMTLSNLPYGVWDGRWSHLYPRATERAWMRIINSLRRDVGYAQVVMEEVVFADAYDDFETRRLSRRLRRL